MQNRIYEESNFYRDLDAFAASKEHDIRAWIKAGYGNKKPPMFTSVDIRNAGFKIAHVDTNLFPAGFNNLSKQTFEIATAELVEYMKTYFADCKKVLLVPENFTRNIKYLENVAVLQKLLSASGCEVLLGSLFIESDQKLDEPKLLIHSLKKEEGKVITSNGWQPDLIVLNNDLTSGVPELFQEVSQPILPYPEQGWHMRRKHTHFEAHRSIVEKFASEFDIDSWLISTETKKCGQINFRDKKGLECIANHVDRIIHNVDKKYKEYNIPAEPYVFVKADNGTYGVGIMTVKSGQELLDINKKSRHSMNVIKQGIQNSEVIVQEGVPTVAQHNGLSSETLAYLVGGKTIDLITRWHPTKDAFSNLNSKGAEFKSQEENKFGIKNVIAELAALATTRESEFKD